MADREFDEAREILISRLAGVVFDTVFPNPAAVTTATIRNALDRAMTDYVVRPVKPELELTTAQHAALCNMITAVARWQASPNPMKPMSAAELRAILGEHFSRVMVVTDDLD